MGWEGGRRAFPVVPLSLSQLHKQSSVTFHWHSPSASLRSSRFGGFRGGGGCPWLTRPLERRGEAQRENWFIVHGHLTLNHATFDPQRSGLWGESGCRAGGGGGNYSFFERWKVWDQVKDKEVFKRNRAGCLFLSKFTSCFCFSCQKFAVCLDPKHTETYT